MRLGRTGRFALATLVVAGTGGLALSGALAASDDSPLYVYSTAIPSGADVDVKVKEEGTGTKVTLKVKGLAANTQYGAHAHNNACSPTDPAAAGPHFQYLKDPVTPSTNPAYANPSNEIWLDFTTNAAGNATSTAEVDWTFPADRRAKSVIIHVEHTHTGPTDSGVAGARLACVNVDF